MKCKALLAGVPALVAALAMAPAASAAATPTSATPAGSAFADSNGTQNWTGYVDVAHSGQKFRYVASNFKVPTVKCTSSSSKASFWVGLDGYGNKTVEQDGISTNCLDGDPVYTAWLEMFPKQTDYIFSVFPGDSIFMSVTHDFSNGRYYFTLEDKTIHRSFVNLPDSCPSGSTCDSTTAEVILEAANGGDLSKFSKVTFTGSVATTRTAVSTGFRKTSAWNLAEPLMTGSNGKPLASVSGTSDNGEDFSFSYDQP
ncbi:MAG: G1 family glutamic endopeptidase [Streptosporangiaceae bacterium]